MTLLRAAARTMLASYFVASGVKALRDPGPLVPAAEPVAEKLVPLVKQYAPDLVAGYIPEDAKTLVRVNGAVQVIGGLALATGKGRRVGSLLLAGSLIPSTAAKHPFWTRKDAEEKALDRGQFLKNVSLLGGVLLAAGDTEGKPSLVWRAQKGGQAIGKATSKTSNKIAKKAGQLTDGGSDMSDFADAAMAGGAALVGTVVATSRRAQKVAAKQLKQAQDLGAKRAEEARKAADAAAKQAKKDAPRKLKEAKKLAAEQAATDRQNAAEAKTIEAADRKAAAKAAKDAPKQLKAAQKQAKQDAKNIQRGEN